MMNTRCLLYYTSETGNCVDTRLHCPLASDILYVLRTTEINATSELHLAQSVQL